jgi:hypothetical protein
VGGAGWLVGAELGGVGFKGGGGVSAGEGATVWVEEFEKLFRWQKETSIL